MAGTKKTRAKKTAPSKAAGKDFGAAFAALKKILQRHARSLSVKYDKPGNYYLETRSASFKGRPVFFGAVQIKKSYVGFHLMPVYACPEMLKGMSAALKSRMQGKSCFNFNRPDAKLFGELSKLTDAGIQKFRAGNLL